MDAQRPKALIMSGYGINCERETEYAFARAGADTRIVHINDLVKDKAPIESCDILVFPGGFSMGDDTGSGLAYANYARDNLSDALRRFMERDTLAIGICNGFQIMTRLGFFPVVPNTEYGIPETALVSNTSARYIDRWVQLVDVDSKEKCVWTEGMLLDRIHIPIAHGEGRFYADEATMQRLRESGQIVLKYAGADGAPAAGGPANPNGALDDIAGICDPSGRFFGLMPHPERAILSVQDPRHWKLRELALREDRALPEETACMKVFRNAVDYFSR
jgi:phosphoribosylformylglycinamidine synthase